MNDSIRTDLSSVAPVARRPGRDAEQVKNFYVNYHDRISEKRFNSPYWLRRYAHRWIHEQFLVHLKPGDRVLDAGCGEGVLSCLAAQRGVNVVGVDISPPNIAAARRLAAEWGVEVEFQEADAENLPFPDNSFDVVLSSHVLEHLPDLDAGLHELYRVSRDRALIAMPTCLNPAAWALLGEDVYWRVGRRTPLALSLGVARTLHAWIRGEEGPDQGYAGVDEVPHVWRFPHVMRRQIESAGFHIERFEAGPLIAPYVTEYLPFLRPLQPRIERLRALPFVRNFGFGSMAVCRK